MNEKQLLPYVMDCFVSVMKNEEVKASVQVYGRSQPT